MRSKRLSFVALHYHLFQLVRVVRPKLRPRGACLPIAAKLHCITQAIEHGCYAAIGKPDSKDIVAVKLDDDLFHWNDNLMWCVHRAGTLFFYLVQVYMALAQDITICFLVQPADRPVAQIPR